MKKDFLFSIIFFLVTTLFFFCPVFKGHIPFPGDLLVNLAPYSSYSYLGYAPGGVPNMAQGMDIIREGYPWKYFVIESLRGGELPFWSPYNFSGNPIMANFQSAVFSPFNIFLFLQPFYFAWTIFIFSAPFLAAVFNYLFLRELKLSKTASVFGGIVFAFCSYMVVWMEYGNITQTFLWLPLALLFAEKLHKHFTRKYLLFLTFTLLGSLSSGYIQGYFYVFIITTLYFLVKITNARSLSFKRLTFFLIALSSPIFLFLFQLFPTYELFSDSSRGSYSLSQIENLLNPWWYAITVVLPNFFGHPAARNFWFTGTYIERVSYFGLIPFILAITALQIFKKNIEVKFFASIFIITFLISFDIIFTKYIYTLPIPVLSTTVPTRILGIFQFCGSVLAAFGLSYFIQKKYSKNFFITAGTIFIVILSVFIFTFFASKLFLESEWTLHMDVARRNIFLPLVIIFSYIILLVIQFFGQKLLQKLNKQSHIIIPVLVVFITVVELFYFFHKITPFSPKEFIYPQTTMVEYIQKNAGIYRYWGYGSAYINSNFQLMDKTFSPEGDDPLHVRSYTEFLESSKDGKIPEELPRPDANVAEGYGNEDLYRNNFRQKLLNVIGVKYIVHKDDGLGKDYKPDALTFREDRYKLVWQDASLQIYENLNVVPRVFLTNDYLVIKERSKIIDIFYSASFNEKKTIILNEMPVEDVSKFTKGSVDVVDYQNNKVIIRSTADASALLFLSDTYYPLWKAKIDGKETKVLEADFTFRSVVVPKGEHTVEFYYDQQMFKTGLALSGVFAILLTFLLIKLRLKDK